METTKVNTTGPIEKLQEYLRQSRNYDRRIRGEIIYLTVAIESLIEQIIAEHFSDSEEQPLFISLMFTVGQITFSQKIQILKKLLKQSYPDFLQLFPKLFSSLEKIRELRNKLAHSREGSPREVFEMFMEGKADLVRRGTYLEYFKDGEKKQEFIAEQKIEEILTMARIYHRILSDIEMEVRNRSRKLNNINFSIALRYLRQTYPDLVN